MLPAGVVYENLWSKILIPEDCFEDCTKTISNRKLVPFLLATAAIARLSDSTCSASWAAILTSSPLRGVDKEFVKELD